MKYATVIKARKEALRFIEAVDAYQGRARSLLQAKRSDEEVSKLNTEKLHLEIEFSGYGTKEAGALKRASSDLGRVLADLRQDR